LILLFLVSEDIIESIEKDLFSNNASIFLRVTENDFQLHWNNDTENIKLFLMVILTFTVALSSILSYISRLNKIADKILILIILAQLTRIFILYNHPIFLLCQLDLNIFVGLVQFQELLEIGSLVIYLTSAEVFNIDYLKKSRVYFLVVFIILQLTTMILQIFFSATFYGYGYIIFPSRIVNIFIVLSMFYYLKKGLSFPPTSGQGVGIIILFLHLIYSILYLFIFFVPIEIYTIISLTLFCIPVAISTLKIVGIYRTIEIVNEYILSISKTLTKSLDKISLSERVV